MRPRGPFLQAVSLFAGVGLVGPVVRWAFRPPAFDGGGKFVSSFVALLWPSHILTLIDPHNEHIMVLVASVAANILPFVVVGCLAALARTRMQLVLLYACYVMLLGWASKYLIGPPFAEGNVWPFSAALAVYALPFILVARLKATSSSRREPR